MKCSLAATNLLGTARTKGQQCNGAFAHTFRLQLRIYAKPWRNCRAAIARIRPYSRAEDETWIRDVVVVVARSAKAARRDDESSSRARTFNAERYNHDSTLISLFFLRQQGIRRFCAVHQLSPGRFVLTLDSRVHVCEYLTLDVINYLSFFVIFPDVTRGRSDHSFRRRSNCQSHDLYVTACNFPHRDSNIVKVSEPSTSCFFSARLRSSL